MASSVVASSRRTASECTSPKRGMVRSSCFAMAFPNPWYSWRFDLPSRGSRVSGSRSD